MAQFYKRLSEHSTATTGTELTALLQADAATVNLWSEYKYKGYAYLTKKTRKQLYVNLQRIADDFAAFHAAAGDDDRGLEEIFSQHTSQLPAPHTRESWRVMTSILRYLSPSSGRFRYQESSSFGRLLKDPTQEPLVGDCNQIVTLYIYLYSRYLPITDLKLRVLPGHVALHLHGVDIEATNASLANYADTKDASLAPIYEIASINLLDTSDIHFKQHTVASGDFLQCARLAAMISSNRELTLHNLDVAYSRIVRDLMQTNNFPRALTYAKASRDMTLRATVGHNGALYYISKQQFKKARTYASYALKKSELTRSIDDAEGRYYYQKQRYHEAIKSFEKTANTRAITSCYEALFFLEQKKLGSNLTSSTIKQHRSTIQAMSNYAKRSGNKKLISHADSLKKHL